MRNVQLLGKACPRCLERDTLVFNDELVLLSDPGSHSLAGVQMKLAAKQRVILTCTNGECATEWRGRLENVTLSEDATTFLSGHFIEEPETK